MKLTDFSHDVLRGVVTGLAVAGTIYVVKGLAAKRAARVPGDATLTVTRAENLISAGPDRVPGPDMRSLSIPSMERTTRAQNLLNRSILGA